MAKLAVLLVEDDREYVDFLASACQRHGFEAKSEISFAAARLELERRAYDVVVADLCVPDESGIEFVRHVRSVSPRSAVLAMTLAASQARACLTSLCGYMVKPFHHDDLILRIGGIDLEALRLAQPTPPARTLA
jgi:DNA-binding response OmpR family regulator